MSGRIVDEESIDRKIAAAIAANPGGVSSYLVVTKELINSQVISLPSSSIELIASPGVGKAIIPLCARAWIRNYQNDYATIDANASISIKSGTNGIVILQGITENPDGWVSTLLADGSSSMFLIPTRYGISNSQLSFFEYEPTEDFDNDNLIISMSNGGLGNLTGGNNAQSLIIQVDYMVIDL